MNTDELNAQVIFDQVKKEQHLLTEFEGMRPSWKSSAIRFISMMGCMGFMIWMYPEIMPQPVLYTLMLLIFCVSSEVYSESKRINKRLDTLYKLLKDGQ